MDIKLKIWRQSNASAKGSFKLYDLPGIDENMSFLEMLDVLNEKLLVENDADGPVAFDHDCREGICGMCSLVINGEAHGSERGATVCQLYMRKFHDGQTITIEPWRARAFPLVKDLTVDRTSFDRIIQAGGYVSVKTGGTPDANLIAVPKEDAETAMDAAACIGCGACVAACPNASAMLFTSAKIAHLAHVPQGQTERYTRVLDMVETHDDEGFGNCTNHGACQNACPKGISVDYIAQLNRDLFKAAVTAQPEPAGS